MRLNNQYSFKGPSIKYVRSLGVRGVKFWDFLYGNTRTERPLFPRNARKKFTFPPAPKKPTSRFKLLITSKSIRKAHPTKKI